MKFPTLLITLFLLTFSVPAFSQVSPINTELPLTSFAEKDVKKVTSLLSAFHALPEKSTFEKIKSSREIVLSLSHANQGWVSDRALLVLGKYWPSSDVYLFYARKIADDKTKFGARSRLMIQMGKSFGDRALPIIAFYLKSKNPQLRVSAIQALISMKSPKANEEIRDHKQVEKSKLVLNAIQRFAMSLPKAP